MIRKLVLAAAAIAALGTVSLTATPADAKGGKGGGSFSGYHHGGHFRGGFGLGLYAVDSCYRDVWVLTRRGDRVLRTINVCD